MIRAMSADDIACRLLKFEQQLRAYERLHAGELAELWQTLNECKQIVADIVSSDEPGSAGSNAAEPDARPTAMIAADP
jgi:hypothetical protein